MTKYVPKHITIRDDQNLFIKKKCINLSKFVQNKIDEEMSKEHGEKREE